MNAFRLHPQTVLWPTLLLAAVVATLPARAQTNSNAGTKSAPAPAAKDAALAQTAPAPATESVFILPTKPEEGKDPFFPRSLRPYSSCAVIKTNQPAVDVAVDLRLQGISGSLEHRLAIINAHTMEVGEEGEITTPSGRIRVRCLEIKDDSVVVQAGGGRRVLYLRPGF